MDWNGNGRGAGLGDGNGIKLNEVERKHLAASKYGYSVEIGERLFFLSFISGGRAWVGASIFFRTSSNPLTSPRCSDSPQISSNALAALIQISSIGVGAGGFLLSTGELVDSWPLIFDRGSSRSMQF